MAEITCNILKADAITPNGRVYSKEALEQIGRDYADSIKIRTWLSEKQLFNDKEISYDLGDGKDFSIKYVFDKENGTVIATIKDFEFPQWTTTSTDVIIKDF